MFALLDWTRTHTEFFIAGFALGFCTLPLLVVGAELCRSIVRRLLGRD